jgi:AcrR family transcriptional regulator
MSKPTGSNRENLQRTRSHLLAVAVKCFFEYGYAETSTNMIIEKAKSSRGSLYHHFADKKDLFKAVYDSLCFEIADRITNYPYKEENPIDDLIDGCSAYLELFIDQAFAQIVLIDAPHVLGMEYCRSKDSDTAYKALYEGVRLIKRNQQDLLVTDFLSGALDTYALKIATSKDRKKTFKLYNSSFKEYARSILIS